MVSEPFPITLPNSESRLFESSIVGDTFKINICLPEGYDSSNTTYPVVYATDAGGGIFTLWNLTTNLSLLSGELPQLILIGIDYPANTPEEFWQRRQRDLDPIADHLEDYAKMLEFLQIESMNPGGADAFLRFIREELKPFINGNYRANTLDSTYVGISDGGLFGLYVLFHYPDTFNRYVIGSPSINRGNKAVLAYERNYAANHDDLIAKVFLSVGSLEENDPFEIIEPADQFISNLKTLVAALKERNYPSLELTSHIFEGETHLSVIPATYSRGLRAVFN